MGFICISFQIYNNPVEIVIAHSYGTFYVPRHYSKYIPNLI